VAAGADAVLAASIFHWGPNDMISQVKDEIRAAGFEVR
jgi:cyclase